jgi:hypothetical protein
MAGCITINVLMYVIADNCLYKPSMLRHAPHLPPARQQQLDALLRRHLQRLGRHCCYTRVPIG